MTVRVRFAPSPTGYLHIGGARTAMYNHLFAKTMGGKYILRIEDTDTERSERKFEAAQIEDLKWLGITHDEGPDVGGDYGPYRQSERLPIYKAWAEKLIEKGHAYHCFCTEEVLNAKKELAESEKLAPHYDGTCRNLKKEEVESRLSAGELAVIRFHAPLKAYSFHDRVRGQVVFPEGMVGDFVILRANGIPVYNYAVVVDDASMKITHVIRAEEHLPNTLRQLMLYEAFGETPPEFAHVSLLIGEDRQKLSKRHGATSVTLYKEMNYIPNALLNYLCLLGWSHPDETDIFDPLKLGPLFNLDRFTKSAAIYDVTKLNSINGQHLKALPLETILTEVEKTIPSTHAFHQMEHEWKLRCVTVFKDKIQFFQDFTAHMDILFTTEVSDSADYMEASSWETTPKIREYLEGEIAIAKVAGKKFVTVDDYNIWSEHVKGELKIKGKQLFMGMRAVLTHQAHGPDLKFIIPLTPVEILEKRIKH
ncbi:MAG: glutamate--tRNA ligase [Bacteriovorax sp.]|jgi:glutamyl-tRNA synthetase|nr:glutamate--tRNA ligase [Bacteriovorax sp.]